MELRPWQLLPDEMRTKEVRKYYNILMKPISRRRKKDVIEEYRKFMFDNNR